MLKSIILVDDNPKDAELSLEALSRNNLANHVVVLSDGDELLDYLRCSGKYEGREPDQPAVVLLDIKMPRKDGIEALREIKNDPALRSIPIVMLTSSREEPDLQACYDLGVNAYVVKPVNFKEFVSAVRQLGVFWALVNELPPDTRT